MKAIVEFCLREKISPNTVTSISVAVLIVALWLIRAQTLEPALVLLILVQLSDYLDGAIARAMEEKEKGSGITRFGEILDPLRDKALFLFGMYVMPWIPKEIFWAGVALESSLIAVRGFQWLHFRTKKIPRISLPSNDYGKWKAVCQYVMIDAFLLQKCRPEYLPLTAFALVMVLGTLSLIMHLRNTLNAQAPSAE